MAGGLGAKAAVLVVTAVITLGSCAQAARQLPRSADEALGVAERALAGGSAQREIPQAFGDLDRVSPTAFSPAQQARRTQLLARANDRLLADAASEIDAAGRVADQQIVNSLAPAIASEHLTATPNPRFAARLREVTADLVKGQACSAILDAAVPRHDDDPDDSEVQKVAEEGVSKVVAASFNRVQVLQIVNTFYWAKDIIEKGDQVASAVNDDPGQVVQFGRPPIARATIAYTRYCYAPPR